MEVASSGTLPPGITMDELTKTHTSHPRNSRITNVFFRRGFIESMGIGTQEIIESCSEAKMRQPEFYEQAGCFVLKMWSSHLHPDQNEAQFTERQRNILAILKNGSMTPHELLEKLNEKISDRTLRRDLQTLKENNYVGTDGNTWQAKWFLIK